MNSGKFAFFIIALVTGTSLQALAQGGGGAGGGAAGGGAAATGTAGTSSAGSSSSNSAAATQPSNAPFQNPIGQGVAPAASSANRSNAQAPTTAAPAGSPTAAQASQNSGAGHSANGLPIGTTGSGPGSPEQPIGARK